MLTWLSIFACAPAPGPTLRPDSAWSTDDEPADSGALNATACTLEPPVRYQTTSLRVDPAGVVWHLDVAGVVTRYERVGGGACELQGEDVLGTESLEAVTDLELDASGRPFALVFFSEVRRLGPDGAVEASCPASSGHALAPSTDGSVVYTWAIGEELLHPVTLATCAAEEPLAMPRALDTVGIVAPPGFAAGVFDVEDQFPPGMVVDLADGTRTGDLARGGAVGSFAYLVSVEDGWLVADPVDGGLFRLDEAGDVQFRYDPDTLPGGEDRFLGVSAIGYVGDGEAYIAAGDVDGYGVWLAR